MSDTLLLIDLSSLARPLWEMSQKSTNPNQASIDIVGRVRALGSAHPHAAVCCDSGKSFRHTVDPEYKAQRPESPAPYQHQVKLAIETLTEDGFPCWAVRGFEADDIIATATTKALACDGDVLICSDDKDLLQLVGPKVQQKRFRDGLVLDVEAVRAKFGINPEQMTDYLCLVGDASDNVTGAKGIGGVTASKLLQSHGSIEKIYAGLDAGAIKLPDGQTNSLAEFRSRWPTVRELITLRTDVEIPFEMIAEERKPTAMSETSAYTAPAPADPVSPALPAQPAESVASRVAPSGGDSGQNPTTALVRAPVQLEWELEPRSIDELRTFATIMDGSKMFSKFPSAHAVAAVVIAGRELGLPGMASLRGFYSPDGGPPMPHADTIRGIILRSGKVEYFEPTERSAVASEFSIKRVGRPEIRLRYTIEEARQAFQAPKYAKTPEDIEKAWQASNYKRNPADMLSARASMKLGRLVCPDIAAGLYAPEEFDGH